jgi:hypothetical protein
MVHVGSFSNSFTALCHTLLSVRLRWSLASLSSKTTLLVVVPLTFVRTTLIPGLVLSATANLIFERKWGMEDDEVVERELMSSLTPRP